jgi:hypothetical protein
MKLKPLYYSTSQPHATMLSTFTATITVKLNYNITKGTQYSVLLQMSVVLTQQYVMINSEEVIGETECLML